MYTNWMVVGVGLLVMAIGGLLLLTGPPSEGPAFIAGNQPVTEAQVRQKLQSDGWSNVQIVRRGKYFEAMGTKSDQSSKVVIDAQTGRLRPAGDYD